MQPEAREIMDTLETVFKLGENTFNMMRVLYQLELEHPKRAPVNPFTMNADTIRDAADGDEVAGSDVRVSIMRHLNESYDSISRATQEERAMLAEYDSPEATAKRKLYAYREAQTRAIQGLGERPEGDDPEGQRAWDEKDRLFKKKEINRRIVAREMRMHPAIKFEGVYWSCYELLTALLGKTFGNERCGFHMPIMDVLSQIPNEYRRTLNITHYQSVIPADQYRDFGTIYKHIEDDKELYFGEKHYDTFDSFALDMRLVCFNAMVAWPVDDASYGRALGFLTGGFNHDKWQSCCIDRALAAIQCDEFDVPHYPTPEPVMPEFGDWVMRVFGGKHNSSLWDEEPPAKRRRRSDELADGHRVVGPRLRHKTAAYHAHRLIEDLCAHPCSIALRREYMQAFAPKTAVQNTFTTLEDLEEKLAFGEFEGDLAIHHLAGWLGHLFASSDTIYKNGGRYVAGSNIRLTRHKLKHFAEVCKCFFYHSRWKVAPDSEVVIPSRIVTLLRLDVAKEESV